jgi:hypothetical protein
MEEWERDYLVYELAGKFCMILFRWIQKGMKETPEEMASLLEKRLSDY